MIPVLLPVICWCFLFLSFYDGSRCIRSSFLYSSIVWGVLVTAFTELSSVFNIFHFSGMFVLWGIAVISTLFLFFYTRTGFPLRNIPHCSYGFMKVLIGGVFIIVLSTGAVALIAPPNTYDSMTYHMSRVMHWIQNYNVNHYPTSNLRQLHSNPWAEFAIAHFQILSGGDFFANLIQWFSMVGSLVGVTLIAEKLGANRRGQVLAAVAVATLPMGILQASSTQTDYVVSFWLVCLAYFCIRLKRRPQISMSLAVGSALGLAVLTKGTAYFFAFPFLLSLGYILVKNLRIRSIPLAIAIGLIALFINTGHYTRNFGLYSNPIGPNQETSNPQSKYRNDVITASSIASNLIRNAGLHMGTPDSTINAITEKYIYKIHDLLSIDINSPKTTWMGTDFRVHFSTHEDTSGNPFHFILIAVSMMAIAGCRRMRTSPETAAYTLDLIFGYLLFCMFIRWQPWASRLHLPLFVLSGPVIGVVFAKWGRHKMIDYLMLFLIVLSIPWVFKNQSRPLIGDDSILKRSRMEQYFSNRPDLEESYMNSLLLLKDEACNRIGLEIGQDHMEYPIWILLKNMSCGTPEIQHINVENISRKLISDTFIPCRTLVADHYGMLYLKGGAVVEWEGRHGDGWMSDKAKLKIQSAPKNNKGRICISFMGDKRLLNIPPIDVTLTGDENNTVVITIERNELSKSIELSKLLSRNHGIIHVSASKTWRPIDFGIGEDTRNLSVLIEYR